MLQAQRVPQEPQGPPDQQAHLVQRVRREAREFKVCKVFKEFKASRDQPARRAQLEPRDRKVHQGRLVPMEQLEQQVLPEPQVQQVRRVARESKV